MPVKAPKSETHIEPCPYKFVDVFRTPAAGAEKIRKVKKKKGNGYGKGTFIESKIFLSPAFLSLGKRGSSHRVSYASVQVLVLLLGKRQFATVKDKKGVRVKVRTDDNEFTLTYKELSARYIDQPQVTRAFDELLAKGFIKISDPGGTFEKHKAKYSLVEDYHNWRPGDPPIRTRARDRKQGYQGKRLGASKNNFNARLKGTPTRTFGGDTPQQDTHVWRGHPK